MKKTLVLGAGLVIAGCSGGFKPLEFGTPQELMQASESLFRKGDWADASSGFQRVTFQLPSRDSMALRARFMMAETDFAQAHYLEAARQFRRVVDEAPSGPLAPNALLRAADAQAALWKKPELDPTYGDAALATYRELVARYPGTDASFRAATRMGILGGMQAEKEYKNGEFYFKIGAFDSAMLYYKTVVANYAGNQYSVKSLYRLVEIYRRLEYDDEREEMCTHLHTYYADAEGLAERCPSTSG